MQLSAVVQTNPARITLSWPGDVNATGYSVYRKTRDATAWGTPTSLPADATTYVDSSVVVGGAAEYRVSKTAVTAVTNYTGEGYIYSGIQVAVVDSRGKMILIIDNTVASNLTVELGRLQRDLVGDGWTVIRHDVSRTDPVVNVRNLIKTDYNADSTRVKAVFLLGHVPVPYSGDLNPDGHKEHRGAWPADVYYADVNGTWTDSVVTNVTASDPRNQNAIGDGKFDQSLIPSDVELQIGRVDLANLPSFAQPEVELLRQYLNKDHAFRHRQFTVPNRGLIDDNFGVFYGEAFAVNGWRNFAPLCGPANVVAGSWTGTLPSDAYLWAYGCGGGTYDSAGGVTSTPLLAGGGCRAVFTMLFGSYFGDWDPQDNLMRAVLASSPYALTCAWAGRPHWQFHHMGLGETIGFSTRVTQNNGGLYAYNYPSRTVHVALMGDPTLRAQPVAPPSALVIRTNPAGGLKLTWNRSPDPVAGYLVYRSGLAVGPYSRLNGVLVTTNEYVDAAGNSQTYMVRAVKLEVTPSGSYYNPSQGVFQDFARSFGPPTLSIIPASDGPVVGWPFNMLGYHLESASSLLQNDWTSLQLNTGSNAQRIIVKLPPVSDARFLRLSEP